MGCQIQYNDNNTYTISAPNGEESILFQKIKALPEIENESDALRSWLKIYTTTFKEWYGKDWENLTAAETKNLIKEGYLDQNGEPAIFYRGDYAEQESFNYSDTVGKFGQGIYLTSELTQAESFAQKTGKKVFPVFLKPGKSVNFKNVTEFQTAVAKFNKVKTVPSEEQVRAYVSDQHINDKVIIGTGIMGREYNVPSSEYVKSIFTEGFKVESGALFDNAKAVNQFMTEEFQQSRRADQFTQELITRLTTNLGMSQHNVKMVSEDEAALITANAKNPWSGQPAFFYDNKVYFVKGQLNYETAFHEFAHPLIRAIQQENAELFNRIYEDIINDSQGKELLAQAIQEYPELTPTSDQVKEEVVVKALTHVAKNSKILDPQQQPSKGIMAAIKKFLYAIKQILRKLTGKTVKNLKADMTLEELARSMMDDTWNINLDTVTDDDIVAYLHEFNEQAADLRKKFNSPEGRLAVHSQTMELITETRKQLSKLKEDGNVEALKIVLADTTGETTLQTMLDNMRRLSSKAKMDRAYSERIDELAEFEERMRGLLFNLEVIDDTVDKVKADIANLVDSPNQVQALGQVTYYIQMLQTYDTYVERFLRRMEEEGETLSTEAPLIKDLVSIKEKIARGQRDIQKIYKSATRDELFKIWEPMNKQIAETAQKEIERVKKVQAKTEPGSKNWKKDEARIKQLEAERDSFMKSREDMLDHITGKMGDIGFFHAYLESYTGSQDPSIASFGMFIKKNLSEVQTEAYSELNDFINKLRDITKKMGIKPSQLKKFHEEFTFSDDSYKRDEETGEIVPYKVYTFLNEYKGYKYEIAVLNERIGEAEAEFEQNPTQENIKAFIDAVTAKEEHTKYFFNKQFVDEYYFTDDILEASELGREAKKEKETKLAEIEFFQRSHDTDHELYLNFETLEVLWRDYRQMFSLYDEFGAPKQGDELKKAELLREHRDARRKFFKPYSKETLLEGKFETAYNQFKETEKARMMVEGEFAEGTAFDEELARRAAIWVKQNSQIKIKDAFYVERNNIMAKIGEIMKQVQTVKFDEQWEVILESLAGRRDQNGQPVGSEMTEEHLGVIKNLEEEMEKAKEDLAGISGLTPAEWDRMSYFYSKFEKEEALTPDELVDFKKLKAKKSKLGLPKAMKDKLVALFTKLDNLQQRQATDYYIEIMNNWSDEIMDGQVIDHGNVDMFMNMSTVEALFKKSEKFEKWFKENHIIKTKFNKQTEQRETQWHRTYAWSIIKPVNNAYLEKTEIKDDNGEIIETIHAVPTMKYHKREVKDEYYTGYNPATGKIDESGLKNARGQWLPKSLAEMEKMKAKYPEKLAEQPYAYDKYINHEYLKIKQEGGPKYEALELMKEFHLGVQDGLERNAKLGLEQPRFRKTAYEYGITLTKGTAKEKLGELWEAAQETLLARKDQHEDGLNFEEETTLAEMDFYSGDTGKIPIRGKYMISEDQVSIDLTGSMFKYALSAAHNKRLKQIQPIAKAMQALATEHNPADVKNLQKQSMIQRKAKQWAGGSTNRRKKVIDSMVETFFEGKKLFDGSNNAMAIKGINTALGMASHAFFAFDVTSAMKNFLGAQFQIALEGAGSKYFKYDAWHRGRPWAFAAMSEISMQIYKQTSKSLKVQMIDIFDAVQGRMEEKFGESLSRSWARDAAGLTWKTSHRKWLETEATLQLFSAIMHSTKLEQVQADGTTKKIKYIDAWELGEDGNIKLKEGIDKAYDINGEKFNEIKFKNHEVSNLLQGAYANFDQPMVNRYLVWRMVSSMRKFFTKMFLHRYGMRGSLLNPKERYNLPTNDMHMGFYMRNIATLRKIFESRGRHLMYMTKDEWRAFRMGILELAKIALITASYAWLWGFDPDDPDKWKKRRGEMDTGAFFKGSGAMPWMGLTDEEWAEDWNLQGWTGNQLLLLAMHVEAENEHFIPWPGYGMKDMIGLFSQSSIASGPSVDAISKIFSDLIFTMAGDDSMYYKKDTGALNIQQEGEWKFWRDLYKMAGIKGKWVDPTTSMKNFYQMRNKK